MSHSLPGSEDITRVCLPNGITVLCRANASSQAVVIHGYWMAGGLMDPGSRLGLSDFTAAALLRGSQQRSFQEIYDTLESVGASLRFAGGTHTTFFSGQALAEDLSLLLQTLADGLRRPSFPPEQIERLRSQILAGLAIRAQDTGYRAQQAFDQLVYKGHPYSRPEDGTSETIQAIHPADLADFHRRAYGPRGLVVVVVGAIEPGRAIDQVAQVLGDWENPLQITAPALPDLAPLPKTLRKRIRLPGKAQADLVMGVAGPPRLSVDFIPANLGNSILGQFGLMGRLGEVVREQAGLAYYIQSSLGGGLGPGAWDISAGVAPGDLERVIRLVRKEIRRFISSPVTSEELADVQEHYIGSLPLSLESNYGVASALVNLERYQLGLDYYRLYADNIRAVTAEAILQAAQRYLDPDRLAIAMAGP